VSIVYKQFKIKVRKVHIFMVVLCTTTFEITKTITFTYVNCGYSSMVHIYLMPIECYFRSHKIFFLFGFPPVAEEGSGQETVCQTGAKCFKCWP